MNRHIKTRMKVPPRRGAEIRRLLQRTHYYKSARLEKVASPVKKNEKLFLELLHPRMEIATPSATNSKAIAYDEPEEPFTLGIALSKNLATWERWGRPKKRSASIGIFCLTLKGYFSNLPQFS
jgi:hypothetical protein